jgi:hypothetical protein
MFSCPWKLPPQSSFARRRVDPQERLRIVISLSSNLAGPNMSEP